MCRLAGVLLFLLAAALGQQSTLEVSYPEYVFIALDTASVNFDFTQKKSALSRPGYLSRLDPAAYPTYAMPAASTGAFPRCKFAPSEVVKNGAFTVRYKKTGDPGCDGPLYSDGDLLILSNTTWRVHARIVGSRPPEGVTLHVLPPRSPGEAVRQGPEVKAAQAKRRSQPEKESGLLQPVSGGLCPAAPLLPRARPRPA